ncbi:MAG TPA: sigma-54 dependent transcriptional regulator [Acidobacteriota bacterium]|nr:sigma-54 dependent transcriptional regulator [Acidobacteriota bacterium]
MNSKRPAVLVVDDEPAMRLAMARVLERAGFEVTRCHDGHSALEALTARPWDAMISDVRMPGIDGKELLGRALALRPELKVILVTAFGAVEDAVLAVRRGAADYLLKPFAPDALLSALHRALGPAPGEEQARAAGEGPRLVGEDPRFRDLLDQLTRAAATDSTVLLTGESGSGKELAARLIHARSARRAGPFVAVNCAALPGELLEAELFGVRRGAYTGADHDRRGHFERANGGTLLLDEVGDLPLPLQAKLLRALEERAVAPLGAGEPVPVDIRVVAATHQDLAQAVSSGRFRQDLYFRLRVLPLRVPALRERPADIPLLARHIADEVAERLGRPAPRISDAAIARLCAHPWPGNVRELRNVMERAVVLDRVGTIVPADLFLDEWAAAPQTGEALQPGMTIAQMERRLIETTLEAAGGNRTRASEMLGISVRTLRNKLRLFREDGQEYATGVSI